MSISTQLFTGPLSNKFHQFLGKIHQNNIVSRVLDRDFSVWMDNPQEISNRLDWLNSPIEMSGKIPEILSFVNNIREDGIEKVLLLGMGGSSLAPEVFAATFGTKTDFLELHILDSTVPEAIIEKATTFDPAKTHYITSTKSGGTVETISLLNFFYNAAIEKLGTENTGNHFTAITDPDSELFHLARTLDFRHVFVNNPNIGGRYSALSHFGLVPAAIIGCNLESLLYCVKKELTNTTPATELGVFLGAAVAQGRDKMTLIASPEVAPLGIWIEQLIAESTGKNGTGILPIADETFQPVDSYGNDRCFVYLRCNNSADTYANSLISAGYPLLQFNLAEISDLAGAMYQWELGTAIIGYLLKIHPFNQPDVEAAKIRARELIESLQSTGNPTKNVLFPAEQCIQLTNVNDNTLNITTALDQLIAHGSNDHSYLAIQAYLHPNFEIQKLLKILRQQLQELSSFATTIGYGPRYLHSTGQLHKGDAGHGLFLQITAEPNTDVVIPNLTANDNESLSFGTLVKAQAQGDAEILKSKGRSVLQIHLGSDVIFGLGQIIQALNNKLKSDDSETKS